METNEKYELVLREITAEEYSKHLDSYGDYKDIAVALLNTIKLYAFEEDALEEQEEEENYSEHPDRYVKAEFPYQKRKGKWAKAWYDVWANYQIKPDDFNYDLLFIYKIRNLDLLDIDKFLNYQLEKNCEADSKQFVRFLKLVLRKHAKKLLPPEHLETINEWIADKEKGPAISGMEKTKTKGKVKRERDDNVTRLNQEQTALLIYCLRQTKVILKDEYLNNKEAGQAFSALTGYSADTMRQNLNKSELMRIATAKNCEVVAKAMTEIQRLIDKEFKPEE